MTLNSKSAPSRRTSPAPLERLEDRRMMAATVASVNWSVDTGKDATGLHYGLNVWTGMEPDVATNATYKAALADLKPGLIRLHAAEQLAPYTQPRGWLDYDTLNADGQPTWHRPSVEAVVKNVKADGARRMMTISGWPSTMDADNDGRLDANRYSDFGRWCASLVTVVKNSGEFIQYWEPFNEKENRSGPYSDAAGGVELGKIWRQARDAMVAADSRITVGGHSGRDPWNDAVHEGFLGQVGGTLGFASYHQYGFTSPNNDNTQLYDGAQTADWGLYNFRQDVHRLNGTSTPIFMDEYNIYAAWDQDTANRMRSGVGGAWNAIYLADIVETGMASGTAIWNDADGTYGVMDPWNGYTRRPTGHVLRRLNEYGVGDVKQNSTADAKKLEVMAVESGTWKGVMLVNRSGGSLTTRLDMGGWLPDGQAKRYVIGGSGESSAFVSNAQLTGDFTVPADSVVFYRIPRSGSNSSPASGIDALLGQTVSMRAVANNRYVAARGLRRPAAGGRPQRRGRLGAVRPRRRRRRPGRAAGHGQRPLRRGRELRQRPAHRQPHVNRQLGVVHAEAVTGGYVLKAGANGKYVALAAGNRLVASAASSSGAAVFDLKAVPQQAALSQKTALSDTSTTLVGKRGVERLFDTARDAPFDNVFSSTLLAFGGDPRDASEAEVVAG